MTVDATIPTGSTLASDLPALLREERSEINSLWSAVAAVGGAATYESLNMGVGETELELTGAGMVHVMALGAAGAVNLTTISGGMEGQLLLIKGTDANVTVKYGASTIDLNGALDYLMANKDFLLLLNEGGDPETAVDGTWIEVLRTLRS